MFTSFAESWETMMLIEKIYWCFAIPFSLVFVIQVILTIFGGDMDAVEADGDADVSVDSDTGISFQFLSLKNLIAFFTVFGWTGIVCVNGGNDKMACVSSLEGDSKTIGVPHLSYQYYIGVLSEDMPEAFIE